MSRYNDVLVRIDKRCWNRVAAPRNEYRSYETSWTRLTIGKPWYFEKRGKKERKKDVIVKIDILESIVSDALQILVITVIGVTFQDVSILFLCSIDRGIVLNAFQVGRRVVIRKAGFIPGWVVGP